MIICITENSHSWDKFGEPYLVDTNLLIEGTTIKEFLESCTISSVAVDMNDCNLVTYEYKEIQQAIVEPPQKVDKLLSIVFE